MFVGCQDCCSYCFGALAQELEVSSPNKGFNKLGHDGVGSKTVQSEQLVKTYGFAGLSTCNTGVVDDELSAVETEETDPVLPQRHNITPAK